MQFVSITLNINFTKLKLTKLYTYNKKNTYIDFGILVKLFSFVHSDFQMECINNFEYQFYNNQTNKILYNEKNTRRYV